MCHRNAFCYCRQCAAMISQFHEKRSRQTKILHTKMDLTQQVEHELQDEMQLQQAIFAIRLSIAQLRRDLATKRSECEMVRERIEECNLRIGRHTNIVRSLRKKCQRHESVLSKTEASETVRLLRDAQSQLAISQQKLAARLFLCVFPITQHERIITRSDDNEKTKKIKVALAEARKTQTRDGAWIVVENADDQESLKNQPCTFFTIAGCRVADDCHYDDLRLQLCAASRPSDASSRGLIARQDSTSNSRILLALAERQTWAALVYGTQLVNSLAAIFDLCLPHQVSVADLSQWDNKWTESLFETDMIKLNMAVLSVCMQASANPSLLRALTLKRPFANLLQLSRRVLAEPVARERGEKSEQASSSTPLLSAFLRHEIVSECDRIIWQERRRNTVAWDDWVAVDDVQCDEAGNADDGESRSPKQGTQQQRLRRFAALITGVMSVLVFS